MSFSIKSSCKVTALLEHSRTVMGRKDPVTGASIIENINIGWFIHTDLGDGISFGIGLDKPESLTVGDTLEVVLRKPEAPDAASK